MKADVNTAPDTAAIRHLVGQVCDPEIPVLTIADLGILRDVRLDGDTVVVTITPSYSGCPAMDTIANDIRAALADAGHRRVSIETRLAPAWTTAWLSAAGRRKLLEIGIAPPDEAVASKRALFGTAHGVCCPRCRSKATEMLSEFGSTACKALYRCNDCLEPFDYFKCH